MQKTIQTKTEKSELSYLDFIGQRQFRDTGNTLNSFWDQVVRLDYYFGFYFSCRSRASATYILY
jgi:hypothetical protein